MSRTWKENREIYLTLGTHRYQKPIELPACVVVLDTAINRLANAENFVEAIQPFTYVFCERLIYINGLPSAKKGFSKADHVRLSRVGPNLWVHATNCDAYFKTSISNKNLLLGLKIVLNVINQSRLPVWFLTLRNIARNLSIRGIQASMKLTSRKLIIGQNQHFARHRSFSDHQKLLLKSKRCFIIFQSRICFQVIFIDISFSYTHKHKLCYIMHIVCRTHIVWMI